MIKKCRVLINNDAVTVFEFDDVKIQIPAIGRKAETIKVEKKDGQYKIVDGKNKETAVEKAEEEKPEKAKETTEIIEHKANSLMKSK